MPLREPVFPCVVTLYKKHHFRRGRPFTISHSRGLLGCQSVSDAIRYIFTAVTRVPQIAAIPEISQTAGGSGFDPAWASQYNRRIGVEEGSRDSQ
jgi:hypothetical protein